MSKRSDPKDPIKAAAGHKGGKRTVKKYGKRYMRRLAKWGAHCMHRKYAMVPVAQNNFAYVYRETGVVKSYQFPIRKETS